MSLLGSSSGRETDRRSLLLLRQVSVLETTDRTAKNVSGSVTHQLEFPISMTRRSISTGSVHIGLSHHSSILFTPVLPAFVYLPVSARSSVRPK